LQEIAQPALPHCAVPLLALHTLPHAPQLLVVLSWVSHPSATPPLQSPYPCLQEMEQLTPLHCAVPLLALHALPHVPQLLVVLSGVSHPSAGLLLQSP